MKINYVLCNPITFFNKGFTNISNYFSTLGSEETGTDNDLMNGFDYIGKAIRCIFAIIMSDKRFILVLVGLNIAILVFALVAGNILDGGIYVPCFGCAEDGTIFKCASGTGKGTFG